MQNVDRKSWRRLLLGAGLLASVGFVGAGCGDEDPTPQNPPTQEPTDNNNEEQPTEEPVVEATSELDAAIVRLNADGSLDTTFDGDGIARVDFGEGYKKYQDSLWGLALDAQDNVLLFGGKKGDGDRIDTDRVVARVTSAGALDTTFATNGFHVMNIGGLNDNPKHGIVQPDGKIVASGYVNQPTGVGTQSANSIVLLRLNADGTPDTTFGVEGVVNSAPFVPAQRETQMWGMAEAYAVGLAGDRYVTTGYGRQAPTGKVDMVSFRYDLDGTRNINWGTDGVALLDFVGQNDRGRNLVVLPDNRTVVVGSVEPAQGSLDALVTVLDANGNFDPSFAPDGRKTFSFEREDEAFFGVDANDAGTWIAAAGYRAGKVAGVEEDDDATFVLLPLAGAGAEATEVVKAVAISETEDDRFDSAVFHGDKVYASGFVTEGGDSKMLVARFNLDGSLDTTFNGTGFQVVNVAAGGTAERARGLAVTSDGKIVIGGVAEK